jgi:hypothetical protein
MSPSRDAGPSYDLGTTGGCLKNRQEHGDRQNHDQSRHDVGYGQRMKIANLQPNEEVRRIHT